MPRWFGRWRPQPNLGRGIVLGKNVWNLDMTYYEIIVWDGVVPK